jgi:hypothetical protein
MHVRVAPPPEQILAELSSILPHLQHSLEAGTAKAHLIWQQHYEGEEMDPWLYSNITRHGAKKELALAGVFADYDTDQLPFSGLSLHTPRPSENGMLHIRIWKHGGADWSELPPPGTSGARLDFFSQEGLATDGISSDGDWNLILLWHLNSNGLLDSLSLACPQGGNSYRAQYYWHVPVPPAITMVPPAAQDAPAPDLNLVLNTPNVSEEPEE